MIVTVVTVLRGMTPKGSQEHTHRLSPIPIASDAISTLYLEEGSLKSLACSIRVTVERMMHCMMLHTAHTHCTHARMHTHTHACTHACTHT